jgi:hypothetical protein
MAAVIALVAMGRAPRSAGAVATHSSSGRTNPGLAAPPPAPAAPPRKTATVEISFRSTPSGATVFREGSDAALGLTPFTARLDAAPKPQIFTFRRSGWKEGRATVSLDANARVELALAPQQGEDERADEVGREPGTPPKRARGGHRRKDVKLDQSTVLNPFE